MSDERSRKSDSPFHRPPELIELQRHTNESCNLIHEHMIRSSNGIEQCPICGSGTFWILLIFFGLTILIAGIVREHPWRGFFTDLISEIANAGIGLLQR